MHLEEIILQGFKSYTTTVKIHNLTNFSAITGLNGTGKSNIIDGIIFCLNLDTNKTLRIKKLEDLINTNCNEATVFLKFNTCTVSRNINREGKSKIFINNTLSTTKTLKKLLNQNNIQKNAQNVILQGNITKILNLTKNNYLVQETANIRVYMQEKEDALELIQKKEEKLISTKDILRKRAEPYVEKLRSERGIYVEMKRCEEMKNMNLEIVNKNEKILDKNENHKRLIELQIMLKEFEEKSLELGELKKIDERVTSFDHNLIYELKNKIEIIKREVNIINGKMRQNTKEKEENKENIENKKRRTSETKNVDLEEIKKIICALKEKEKLLINEIRNKEANNVGLSKENITDKLTNINELKNEKKKLEIKINEIKNSNLQIKSLDDEKLKELQKEFQIRHETIENNRISTNELNILKSKHSKLISNINYPIMEGVYGSIMDNFCIKDIRHKEIINIILGSRKKYVIVENEKIGTMILEGAKQRVNVIPLNKIRSNIDSKKDKIMEKNSGVNCLELINFDPKMKNAMGYIFGNYYLFEDKAQAKNMCYKEKVPCISMDGNLYDPRGIVTGGTTKVYNEEITKFSEIKQMSQILKDLELKNKEFEEAKDEYNKICKFKIDYENYKNFVGKYKGLEEKISILEKFLNKNMDLKKELQATKKVLMTKENIYNNEMDKINAKNEIEKQRMEEEKELEILIEKKHMFEKEIQEIQKQLRKLEIENEKYSIYEKDKTICEDKLKFLSLSVSKLKKSINKLIEKIKHESNESEKILENSDDLPDYFKGLNEKILYLMPKLKENITILSTDTEDELKRQLITAKRDLEALSKTQRKTMDPKNYEFLEKNEEAIKFLEEKISKLEIDKKKLISKVNDLNKQSEVELKNAHQHLNNEAGKYLRLFLPDSDIKLDDNYNIGVKITNWKNSVNELSGGQRSLVALSLIFAMLSYKPAPFYLFDEVDSALDISMTVNIGLCMKKFKEAQFIVVSLKEEFYRNASSIYQVFLCDGKTNVKKLK